MQVVRWLQENENLILPAWMRRVRQGGGLKKNDIPTQELRHHVFLLYFERLCRVAAGGEFDELEQMLHKLVDDNTRKNYAITQILQFPLQFKSTLWQFLLRDFPAAEAQQMIAKVEPIIDLSMSVLVEAYDQTTKAALNEQLEDFDFLTKRLALSSEETEKAFTQLRSLYAISKTLNSTLDIQHTLEAIADNLVQLDPIEFCVIWQISPQNRLYVGAAKGQMQPELIDATLSLDPPESFVSRAFTTKKRQQIDIDKDALAAFLDHADGVAVPMFNENRAIGVIMTNGQYQGRRLDSSVLSLVQSASEQAAIALENALLYDQVKRFNQELEEQVRLRTRELQETNTELARVNQDLERLDRTKSDFISIAAHELKTPLTLIQGYTNIMRDDGAVKGNPFLTSLLQGIIKGGQRLYDIIENMIDVSMIDTQVLQLRPSKISIGNIMRTLASQYAEALQERQIKLEISAFKKMPYIEADAKRIHQVFENLVVNAIKYTPDGGWIKIEGSLMDTGPDEQWVEIVISDSGIGISPDDLERIFEKFYQTGELALHSTGKTKFKGGGPGLGLAIAKGIVEAHGGKIWAESECYDEEKCPGSKFYVILPVKSKITLSGIVSPFSYSKQQ